MRFFFVFVSVCVFNVWPKTTLLPPVWPRDDKMLDTPGREREREELVCGCACDLSSHEGRPTQKGAQFGIMPCIYHLKFLITLEQGGLEFSFCTWSCMQLPPALQLR